REGSTIRTSAAGQRQLVNPLMHEAPNHAPVGVETLDPNTDSTCVFLLLNRRIGDVASDVNLALARRMSDDGSDTAGLPSRLHQATHRLEHGWVALGRWCVLRLDQTACRNGHADSYSELPGGLLTECNRHTASTRHQRQTTQRMIIWKRVQSSERVFGARHDERVTAAGLHTLEPRQKGPCIARRRLRHGATTIARDESEAITNLASHIDGYSCPAQRLQRLDCGGTVAIEYQCRTRVVLNDGFHVRLLRLRNGTDLRNLLATARAPRSRSYARRATRSRIHR